MGGEIQSFRTKHALYFNQLHNIYNYFLRYLFILQNFIYFHFIFILFIRFPLSVTKQVAF